MVLRFEIQYDACNNWQCHKGVYWNCVPALDTGRIGSDGGQDSKKAQNVSVPGERAVTEPADFHQDDCKGNRRQRLPEFRHFEIDEGGDKSSTRERK